MDENKNKIKEEKELNIIDVLLRGNIHHTYDIQKAANIQRGDRVIVEVDKGSDIGLVDKTGKIAEYKRSKGSLNLIRKANDEDIARYQKTCKEEQKMFFEIKDKIKKHKLNMNLLEVEIQFDKSKIICFFLAEQRVDFRELIKDLAQTYHTRIELRQIGIRDEAKRIGGIGVCGRPLCCTMFLKSFAHIGTQMARDQHLSINQVKLSGNCNRLKCCLSYEIDFYTENNKRYPDTNTTITFSKTEKAKVMGINLIKQEVRLNILGKDEELIIKLPEDKNFKEISKTLEELKEYSINKNEDSYMAVSSAPMIVTKNKKLSNSNTDKKNTQTNDVFIADLINKTKSEGEDEFLKDLKEEKVETPEQVENIKPKKNNRNRPRYKKPQKNNTSKENSNSSKPGNNKTNTNPNAKNNPNQKEKVNTNPNAKNKVNTNPNAKEKKNTNPNAKGKPKKNNYRGKNNNKQKKQVNNK